MANFGPTWSFFLFFAAFDHFCYFCEIFCVFVDSFAENVLNFMLISNKKIRSSGPLTASSWSDTQNLRGFHIFLDDKLAIKTILRVDVKFSNSTWCFTPVSVKATIFAQRHFPYVVQLLQGKVPVRLPRIRALDRPWKTCHVVWYHLCLMRVYIRSC
jgi:hypothetical protein